MNITIELGLADLSALSRSSASAIRTSPALAVASLIHSFQQDIIQPKKTTTELLRTAKLIAAKLNLPDIVGWLNAELSGYGNLQPPVYRQIHGGDLQVLNPVLGW